MDDDPLFRDEILEAEPPKNIICIFALNSALKS
jgi:hypothetical protein